MSSLVAEKSRTDEATTEVDVAMGEAEEVIASAVAEELGTSINMLMLRWAFTWLH